MCFIDRVVDSSIAMRYEGNDGLPLAAAKSEVNLSKGQSLQSTFQLLGAI